MAYGYRYRRPGASRYNYSSRSNNQYTKWSGKRYYPRRYRKGSTRRRVLKSGMTGATKKSRSGLAAQVAALAVSNEFGPRQKDVGTTLMDIPFYSENNSHLYTAFPVSEVVRAFVGESAEGQVYLSSAVLEFSLAHGASAEVVAFLRKVPRGLCHSRVTVDPKDGTFLIVDSEGEHKLEMLDESGAAKLALLQGLFDVGSRSADGTFFGAANEHSVLAQRGEATVDGVKASVVKGRFKHTSVGLAAGNAEVRRLRIYFDLSEKLSRSGDEGSYDWVFILGLRSKVMQTDPDNLEVPCGVLKDARVTVNSHYRN